MCGYAQASCVYHIISLRVYTTQTCAYTQTCVHAYKHVSTNTNNTHQHVCIHTGMYTHNMCVYTHTCVQSVYTHKHIYTQHVCIYNHVCMHIAKQSQLTFKHACMLGFDKCVHKNMCVCCVYIIMCIYNHVCMHMHIDKRSQLTCKHACMSVWIYTYIHVYTYVCIYMYIHVCLCGRRCKVYSSWSVHH